MQKKHVFNMYWKSMVTNVFLDTNIIMDMFDEERKTYQSSLALVKELLSTGTTLYVNSDTLTTAFYLLRNQALSSDRWKEVSQRFFHQVKSVSSSTFQL